MSIDLHNLLTSDMKLDSHTFAGQVIVVTGAGQGIGFQVARAFALLGGKVVLAELSKRGAQAASAIRDEGGEALFVPTDVSDPGSVAHLIERVSQAYGPVDVLVNNAIFISHNSVEDMPVEDWDRTIAVNLRGTFLTSRAVLPEMRKKNRGLILNMVSTDAMPGLSAYLASKGGITSFSQSLALELDGTGIYVIPFGPGMVDTPGIRSVAPGLAPQLGLAEAQLLNLSLHAGYDGLMPPEHAGAASAYLSARLAEEFNGQVVNGYEVLERAGVLQASEIDLPHTISFQTETEENIQALFEQVCVFLDETEAEFAQLPVFARPLAKAGFKSKAGLSLADWQRLAASQKTGQVSNPALIVDRLGALATYFREVPKETARFTKDEATLKMVTETAQVRLAVLEKLISKLS